MERGRIMTKKQAPVLVFIILMFLAGLALDWQDASTGAFKITWDSVTIDTSGTPLDTVPCYRVYMLDEYVGETYDTFFLVATDNESRACWKVIACTNDYICSVPSPRVTGRAISFMPQFAAETLNIYIRPAEITTIAYPCAGDRISCIITDSTETYIDSLEIDYVRDGFIDLSDLAVFALGYASVHLRTDLFMYKFSSEYPTRYIAIIGERYNKSGVLIKEY
jgi:hypothetical protein